jgi:hypothetical protein
MPEGRGVLLWITAAAEGATKSIRMPANPVEYAAGLYVTLHGLDDEFWDWIAVEAPPEGQEWDGIRDRLTRAAHSKNLQRQYPLVIEHSRDDVQECRCKRKGGRIKYR